MLIIHTQSKLCIDMGGWADISWKYHEQYDNLRTGKPLGPGQAIDDEEMKFKVHRTELKDILKPNLLYAERV